MGTQQSKFSSSVSICVHLWLKTLSVQIISGLPDMCLLFHWQACRSRPWSPSTAIGGLSRVSREGREQLIYQINHLHWKLRLNSSKNKRLYVAHTFVATVVYE